MARFKYHTARVFHDAALQRYDDAVVLLEHNRLTGAYYLAGYGVECILKALVLSEIGSPKQRSDVEHSFRGQAGHNIEELRRLYVKVSGRTIPTSISRLLFLLKTWETDIRYESSARSKKETVAFLNAVADVFRWAEGFVNNGSSQSR